MKNKTQQAKLYPPFSNLFDFLFEKKLFVCLPMKKKKKPLRRNKKLRNIKKYNKNNAK